MKEGPIDNEYELFEALRLLIARAEAGGLPRRHLNALFDVGERIMADLSHIRQDGEEGLETVDQRRHLRLPSPGQGHAIYQERRLPVEVVDLGARGFGIVCSEIIPSGSFILLEMNSLDGMETFSCFVAFCREKGASYRMGLRIFAKLPHT
ncbi:MAG: hypothetical protein HQL51_09915 [Magnetococcales bacterium]|nr:hypothetical protein [Magnetococcales bacterium]